MPLALLVIPILISSGCAVPQRRGGGEMTKVTEPTTKRSYYLYLPKEYVQASEQERAARRWPTVVSFHGMKPFDVASAQCKEWQQEADRYGFVVVAPILNYPVVFFGQFPQHDVTAAFKSDELAVLAILDHVFQTTEADPSNVLSTSWSSGGYMAHYMLNRHPDRFTCLAVRQSNFSASLLDPGAVEHSLYHPVMILMTQNDFAVCKKESREAIHWYETHGYKNFGWVEVSRLGHQRTPDTAADFFARIAGVKPNRPPLVLTHRQAIDGNETGLALLRGELAAIERRPTDNRRVSAAPYRVTHVPAAPTDTEPTESRPTAVVSRPVPRTPAPQAATPPRSSLPDEATSASAAPVGIRVSSAIGFQPLLLTYSAEVPTDWQRTADFNWTLDGEAIGNGVNGQKTIVQPGDYVLHLRVVTADGAEHAAARRIRVLRSLETRAGSGNTPTTR